MFVVIVFVVLIWILSDVTRVSPHGSLHHFQKVAIENIIAQRHVLLLAPTGGEKMLAYQLSGLAAITRYRLSQPDSDKHPLVLVITPLLTILQQIKR